MKGFLLSFQEKTDQDLEKISQDYYEKYGKYLEDASLSIELKDIDGLIKKNKLSNPAKEKKELFDFLKEYLTRKIKALAIIEYLIMEKGSNFGTMGEQRTSISFCRNLLNIACNREVTQFDADRFRQLVDEFDEKNGKKLAEAYLDLKKNFNINFFGVKINAMLIGPLSKYLEYLKTPFSFYITYSAKGYSNFIFGETTNQKIGDWEIVIFEKEYVRSPSLVLSIAAEGSSTGKVLIRRESCEVIFFNKWQRFFDQSKLEHKRALNHKNSAIREGVKAKALELYNAKTVKDVENIKNLFIDEMIDGILWHELGHKSSKKDKTESLDAFGNVFVNTDNVISVLNEILGDWAPLNNKNKGAITRFLEIAEQDLNKATRCIYVYLSDNWFVDEEEEFMSLQTDLLTALILHFIDSDGTIDLNRLAKEKDKIYDFALKSYKLILEEAYRIIKKGKYQIGIHSLDYTMMQKEILKLYKEEGVLQTEAELLNRPNFWFNLWGYVKKFSPETFKNLNDYFETAGKDLRIKMLKILTKGDTSKFNDSLREYIYFKYKECGILKERITVEYTKAVELATSRMKMPDKVAAKVKDQFKDIMAGKNYDISISYEGKPDPFLATIQEMMLKSNYGDINAGMALGELYEADEPIEKRKEYIKNELEGIRDQIESEMYLEVESLKVNKKYNARPMVEELIETVTLLDNHKLKEKIQAILFEELKSDALMEVFVPLKRGFMDWNTSQAVWRINQDIRPDEFTMQWTIDQEFIEALVNSYL